MTFLETIKQNLKGDKVIWSIIVVLSFVSLLAVYSSTGSLAYRMDKNSTHFLVKQVFILALGLGIIYVVHRINYTKFARLSLLLYIICVPLLVYTLFFGTTLNEGSRWIKLPVINITFQTSDFAKLALFLFLARMLSVRQNVIKDFKKGFVPILYPVLIVCLLIAPANLSTALLLGFTCCLLFFIGRVQVKHILLLALAGVVLLTFLFMFSKATWWGRADTWEKRVEDFLGTSNEAPDVKKESTYQTMQAKIAIANGGLIGRGPGNSQQRNFLPHPYSDFIYSIIIEEYGWLGGSALVCIYLLLLWRSILIFRRCPYAFGAFLAVGLSITLVFQAMLNMAVNVHLVPVTGLTLPMINMGGSSIWFNSIAIGVVLSVSRYVNEMEGKKSKTIKNNSKIKPAIA